MNTARYLLLGSIASAAILAGCSGSGGSGSGSLKSAPDFTLESLSGQSISLAQRRGQVVLIGFWAVK